MTNLISGSISGETEAAILAKIEEIEALLPIKIALSKDQKSSMVKMDDGRLPFTQKGLQYGLQDNKVAPPYIDLTEQSNDIGVFQGYSNIRKRLDKLTETVENVRIAAGSDAYSTALVIYRSIQGAAKTGVPGAQAMYDDLKKLFEGQGKSNASPDSTQTT